MSKTDPIQLRKEIHERIKLFVYGPDGREQETAAGSWELAGVLTAALLSNAEQRRQGRHTPLSCASGTRFSCRKWQLARRRTMR